MFKHASLFHFSPYFLLLGDIPFHPFPLLFKWTKLWTWTFQPLGLRSSQRGLLYLGGLCPWPWRTCPLHNIGTLYDMHTHEVIVTNLRWNNLMLVILCISSGKLNDTLDTSFDHINLRIKAIRPSSVLELQGPDGRTIWDHSKNCVTCHLQNLDPTIITLIWIPPLDHPCQVC
jgi:hypothetical protein